MMDEKDKKPAQINQTQFLSELHKATAAVTIFLVNGVKLQGVIDDYDAEIVILERGGHRQMVYKHAISTIMPSSTLSEVSRGT